jgi:PAS domain-containing protein
MAANIPKKPSALGFRALFESSPGLYLVLTPDFRIVAASNAYLPSHPDRARVPSGP